jgi:hypothetical protein
VGRGFSQDVGVPAWFPDQGVVESGGATFFD